MNSPLTGRPSRKLFSTTVLGSIPVDYYRCADTGFIHTETPHWLDRAYASAITSLDLGYASRNYQYADVVERMLLRVAPDVGRCLDFGGGYGLFVRLMRDRGFDFYLEDAYCDNLFAVGFEVADLPENARDRFDAITLFEVLEHLPDPLPVLEGLFARTGLLVGSTELQPEPFEPTSPDDWWYFLPETGQHVSLYNRRSLEYIAEKLGGRLYTDGRTLHVISRDPLPRDPFAAASTASVPQRAARTLARWLQAPAPASGRPENARESLLQQDFERARRRLNDNEDGAAS
ncbi:class I SAM-dependent methyltransferase [Alienimonas sp. DA493]|uniref:class I SAM-dependent methyltransferase n=1 Tax=Alienimonas sp. DA493 TaxID=3373605 RepID=UPI00375523F3